MADSNSQWQIQRQFHIHQGKFNAANSNSPHPIKIHHGKFNSGIQFNLTQQIPGHLANSYSLWQIQIHYVKFKFRKANQIFNSPHQIQFHHGKFKFSKAISNSLRPGFYVGFFVWGEVDPEKKFWATRRWEKIFVGLLGGPKACCPGKFWKYSVQDWLKSHFWTLVTFTDSLKSSSKKDLYLK